MNIELIASGRSFRKRHSSNLPTSNVDILPTILYLYRRSLPPTVQGRVMHELLDAGRIEKLKPVKRSAHASIAYAGGIYRQELSFTELGEYLYPDFLRTYRKQK